MTPLIYKKGLWETSGHWQNYMDDMYMVQGGQKGNDEEGLFGLKPMNCPGHCLIFDSTPKSYRDLPIRLADFSPLHRQVPAFPSPACPSTAFPQTVFHTRVT